MRVHYSVQGLKLTGELEKYANGKFARLNRKVPRYLRAAASWDVAFAQTTRKGVKLSTCAIVLTLGDTELKATEDTQHLYAALDIATVHIEQQLKGHLLRRRGGLLGRFRRRQ